MLKEITTQEMSVGQNFILSYWRRNRVISNWVEFVDADEKFVYFRVSQKIAPNRDPQSYTKMDRKSIRALFTEGE